MASTYKEIMQRFIIYHCNLYEVLPKQLSIFSRHPMNGVLFLKNRSPIRARDLENCFSSIYENTYEINNERKENMLYTDQHSFMTSNQFCFLISLFITTKAQNLILDFLPEIII